MSESLKPITLTLDKKRPFAYLECIGLQNSLQILRRKWKTAGFYQKAEIEQQALQIKKDYEKQKTQLKIYVKQGLDEFGKEVVDSLF